MRGQELGAAGGILRRRWSLIGASSAPLRPKVAGTCVRLTQVSTRGIEAGERLTRDFAQVPRVEARPPLGAPRRRLTCLPTLCTYLVTASYLSTKQPAGVVPMLGFTGLFLCVPGAPRTGCKKVAPPDEDEAAMLLLLQSGLRL